MNKMVKMAAVSAALAFLLFVACPVQAGVAGDSPPSLRNAGDKGDRMVNHLDRLEEAGYDVSAIRAAVESGDMDTARTLMQQFMEEYKGELPAPPEKGNRMQKQPDEKGDRMVNHLDRLEEAGYDVSAIRAAVESGDMDTARTLMQQFIKEHKGELPAPPAGGRLGMGGMKARASQET